jgi:hypothetical protein
MFETDSADTCAGKVLLMLMGGGGGAKPKGQHARTTIGVRGKCSNQDIHLYFK